MKDTNNNAGLTTKLYHAVEASVSPEVKLIHNDAESNLREIYLCPAEVDKNEYTEMSTYCDKFDECLFEKNFQQREEKKCKVAPKSGLVKIDADRYSSLGCTSKSNILYAFSLKVSEYL